MYGVILTIFHYGVSTQKIEGFKSQEDVIDFVEEWKKSFRDTATFSTIYKIEDSIPQQGTFYYTETKSEPNGAFIDMRPQDLYNKLWNLRQATRLLKQFICDDPMQTASVIANATTADYIARELFDAYPEDEVDNEKTET